MRVHKESLRRLPPRAVASSRVGRMGKAHRHPRLASRAGAQQPRAARARGRRLPHRGGRAGRTAPFSPPSAPRARRPERRPARRCAQVPVRSGARAAYSAQLGRPAARPHCSSLLWPLCIQPPAALVRPCLLSQLPGAARQPSAACPGAGRPRRSLTCVRPSTATLEAGGLPAAASKARACSRPTARRLITSGRRFEGTHSATYRSRTAIITLY